MNQLNQKLASVRRQKKVYETKMKETKEPQEQWDLSHKIMVCEEEESKLLKQLGVKIDSNNR